MTLHVTANWLTRSGEWFHHGAFLFVLGITISCSNGCADRDAASLGYEIATENLGWRFPDGMVDTVGAPDVAGGPAASRPQESAQGQAFVRRMNAHELSLSWPGQSAEGSSAPYSVECRRDFDGPEEERLLRVAEETYPGKAGVRAAAATPTSTPTRRPWVCSEFDGIQTPYAVTMDGVRYYVALVRRYAKGEAPVPHGLLMKNATFSYLASIEQRAAFSKEGHRFHDVWVVELHMKWGSSCGNLCAMFFSKERTVVLSRAGSVLAVFGDGCSGVMVS